MKFLLATLWSILLVTPSVMAPDCVDYGDYLHWCGRADTPFIAYDVAVDSTYAYVADSNTDLQIIDVANPEAPLRIGSVPVPGPASGIVTSGGYAYVAIGGAGVAVLALNDPAAPTVLGTVTTPDGVAGVNVTGSLLLAVGDAGLQIIDISDPGNLALRGALPLAGAQEAAGVGDLVCVVTDSLHLVDIADPDVPVALAVVGMPDGPHGVALRDRYAYLACAGAWDGGSLQIVDVSDPLHPVLVGAATGDSAEKIAIAGDVAYLCGLVPSTWHGRFQAFDIANPAAPRRMVATATPGQPRDLVLSGQLAYVADGGGGLEIVDLVNPAPAPVGGAITTPGAASDVATAGNLAYVAAHGDGLQILDVANPETPMLVGTALCPGASAVGVSVERACVLDNDTNELCVVDATDPQAPILAGRVGVPGILEAVAVTGTTACVAANAAGLQIVDLAEMTAPKLVGGLPVGERTMNVVSQGDRAYVMANFSIWNQGLFVVVDVSDPAAPIALGSLLLGGDRCGLAVDGSHVYLTHDAMLYVIDVTDPLAPGVVGEFFGFSESLDIAVAGDFAYVTDSRDGFVVMDVSDPTVPRQTQTLPGAVGGYAIAVADRAVCTTDWYGLRLYWPQCPDVTAISEPSCTRPVLWAHPNPFNSQTRIAFSLSASGRVHLEVYDLGGRLIARLVDESLPSGRHEVAWDGRDRAGRISPSGVYLSRLESGGRVVHGTLTLVR